MCASVRLGGNLELVMIVHLDTGCDCINQFVQIVLKATASRRWQQ